MPPKSGAAAERQRKRRQSLESASPFTKKLNETRAIVNNWATRARSGEPPTKAMKAVAQQHGMEDLLRDIWGLKGRRGPRDATNKTAAQMRFAAAERAYVEHALERDETSEYQSNENVHVVESEQAVDVSSEHDLLEDVSSASGIQCAFCFEQGGVPLPCTKGQATVRECMFAAHHDCVASWLLTTKLVPTSWSRRRRISAHA